MSSPPQFQIVELHPQAPAKPAVGARCNGCGLCCAAEPCPVAMLFLFQRNGRCRALVWQDENRRYVCGMADRPDQYSAIIPARFGTAMGRFFARRIAAGVGCDSTAEPETGDG